MIKQHTFFTVLLCIILAFSIFTVDVYASAAVTYNCHVGIGTSYKHPFIVSPIVTATVSPLSTSSSVRYSYSAQYSFTDYLTLSFTNNDTGVRIPEGTYSFFTVVLYSFTVSGISYPPGSSLPLGIFSSIVPSFDSLPDGMLYHVGNLPTSFDYDAASKTYTYNMSFWLYGTFFTPDSYGLTVSVPLSFDIRYNNGFSSGVPSLFYTNWHILPSVSIAEVYADIPVTRVSSSSTTDSILGSVNDSINDVNDTIKQEHQEEIDKADQATSDVTGGVGQLTNTLSTWEIITMPFNLVKNFAQAIAGDGSSALTFPSFSLMGYQIWPSYTFDLQTVASNFPVLYNGLHLVSGTVVVTGFVRYLWRKWSLLVGDDMPEGSDSS